jgi:aminoglycoside 3-N-acetyltransferase
MGLVSYTDLKLGLTRLGLTDRLVIAHASLRAFGKIEGAAQTVLNTLLAATRGLMMPTFTYKTMLTPEVGPPNNGLTYGSRGDSNQMAEPFHEDMPADKMMGTLTEALRKHPQAKRTHHPILSFAGVGCDALVDVQTIFDPFAPIAALAEQEGWVLLLGVDQTVNTAIHYGEQLAGRKQFVRWALTAERVVECPGFPGDSAGFQAIAAEVEADSRFTDIGDAVVQAIPLRRLVLAVTDRLEQDPLALLCGREDCERCSAVQAAYRPAAFAE